MGPSRDFGPNKSSWETSSVDIQPDTFCATLLSAELFALALP